MFIYLCVSCPPRELSEKHGQDIFKNVTNDVTVSKSNIRIAFSQALCLDISGFRCYQSRRMAGWLRCLFGPNLNRTHRSPEAPRAEGRVARRVRLCVVLYEGLKYLGKPTGTHAAQGCPKRVSLRLTLAVLAKCGSVIVSKSDEQS